MLAGNAMWFKSADTGDRLYQVEAARLLGELNDKDISEIDLSQYKTILLWRNMIPQSTASRIIWWKS